MDDYSRFIHLSRYARWLPSEGRRETWEETVGRTTAFLSPIINDEDTLLKCYNSILTMQTMPSMRLMWSAGPAATKCNVTIYNCAYVPVSSPHAFDEALYVLMCGTGVGYSVERQYINQMPLVPETIEPSSTVIQVKDSRRGWAVALKEYIGLLYAGSMAQWDVSKVRPEGAVLKTMGGRSSGPGALVDLLKFVRDVFLNARGRRLTSLECHDIMCMIGECVVVGGVRRSALISLSNLSDRRMQTCKSGDYYNITPWRSCANNSVAYTEKPDSVTYIDEFLNLIKSRSGERGIFNREAARVAVGRTERRALEDRNGQPYEWGTNPCGEIILRPMQFCNLSTVVARPEDTLETLKEKVEVATILGTAQSTLTNFKYISRNWKTNCEDERLLGVSIGGIMDTPLLMDDPESAEVWRALKEVAINTNKEWAERLKIPQSAAVTCVKPDGNSSQLVGAASGIHPRFAPYYTRRVEQLSNDPLCKFLVESGVPHEPHLTKAGTTVFKFPIASPKGAYTSEDLCAIAHLEKWLEVKQNWCEHNPSATIYVQDFEWPEVMAWVYDNWDEVLGLTFMQHSDHIHRQAPYQEITEEAYEEETQRMPVIEWARLPSYESSDNTGTDKEFCGGDTCLL